MCDFGKYNNSSLLTLYITPVVYIYLESVQQWFNRRRATKIPAKKSEVNPAAV